MNSRNRAALPLLLSFAVMLGSDSATAQDAASRYWVDSWRGWHFYEAPMPEELEHQFSPGKATPTPPPTHPSRAPELVEFERLQKTLEETRNIAIMRPSEANVRRYMELESQVVARASHFADVAQRVAWATPQLDPTLQGRPVNAKALEVFDQAELVDRSRAIADLGKNHVLFFFYRSDCPYCHAFAPTLAAFQARHGIQVVAISVDGGPLPSFPNARPDNGIATTLKVGQVPAVFLAQPFTGKISPIGFGVLSESQLLERIAVVSAPQAEAMLPPNHARSRPTSGGAMTHYDHYLFRRTAAAVLALLLEIPSFQLQAGDLNSEVNNMFNNLGAIGNYTAPGAFRGQTFNTYTGGNLMMRSPNKVYQLAAIQFPSAKAGCGGIDVFGGSFSHISATEFKNMLKNITAALPGIAFQLALEAVSPLLGGLTKWAKGLETWINNARINSCETAKAIVSTAAESIGYSSQETCADLAIEMGMESDRDAARRRCATDRPSILSSARSSADPKVKNKAPFVGNLTWKALQYTGAYLDDQERELIMSLVGTIIYYPEESARDPEPIAPTLTSISQLLYGQGAAAGTDVVQHVLKCNDYSNCDVVTLNTAYTHTPFTAKVEAIMRSIAEKITTRTAIPNNSAEVGFVNQTTEPVYKMLSIGTSIPGSGLADSLIAQYRDVIATDYAYVFLERNLRLGMAALDKNYTLQQSQREQANQVRQRAQAMLMQLSQEKNLLYQKVGSFRAVSNHLEQLERQLRSSMPQHVMDMLGQQAAYLSQ